MVIAGTRECSRATLWFCSRRQEEETKQSVLRSPPPTSLTPEEREGENKLEESPEVRLSAHKTPPAIHSP